MAYQGHYEKQEAFPSGQEKEGLFLMENEKLIIENGI